MRKNVKKFLPCRLVCIYIHLYTQELSLFAKGKYWGNNCLQFVLYIVGSYRATVSGFKGKSYKVLGVYKDGVAD